MNTSESNTTAASFTDRRMRRSESLGVALRYQLDVACGEYGVTHMALASEDGFVLASSGNDDAAVWLAAQSHDAETDTIHAMEEGTHYLLEPPTILRGGALAVEGVVVDGTPMLLVGASRERARLQAGISHASRGVERIFEELWNA